MVRLGWIGVAHVRPDCMRTMLGIVVIVCCVPRPISISKIVARCIIAQQGSEQRTFESNYSIKKSHVTLHKLIE